MPLPDLHFALEMRLNGIKSLFPKGAMATLVVRVPGDDDAGVLLTQDNLEEVMGYIRERQEKMVEGDEF